MNARYRPAHAWAGLVLGGGGVTAFLLDGAWSTRGLLINMNRLWEAVVSRLSAEVSERMGGAPIEPGRLSDIQVEETERPRRPLRPDALISLPTASGKRHVNGLLLPVEPNTKATTAMRSAPRTPTNSSPTRPPTAPQHSDPRRCSSTPPSRLPQPGACACTVRRETSGTWPSLVSTSEARPMMQVR